eukprot:2410032-Amphidinium_carterae.1
MEEDVCRTLRVVSFNTRSLGNREERVQEVAPSHGLNHPGLLVKLLSQLTERDIDIATIQESRLRMEDEKLDIRGFTVIMLAAATGRGSHGGLLIAVRQSREVKVLSHRSFGQRILAASCTIGKKALLVATMHAPVRKSPPEVHQQFAEHVKEFLEYRRHHQSVIIGCDLNCKLGSLEVPLNIIGEHASPCPYQARYALETIGVLHRHQMFFLNTLLSPVQTDHTTWKHPRSTIEEPRWYQIDYIVSSMDLRDCCSSATPLPRGAFDSLLEADHRPLEARFVLWTKKVTTRRKPLRRCVSKEHERVFVRRLAEQLANFEQPHNASAAQRVQEIIMVAARTLEDTKPKKATPRKDWISEATWENMRKLTRVRVSIAKWRHSERDVSAMLLGIRMELGCEGVLQDITPESPECQINNALKQLLKMRVKQVRYALRADKKAYVDQMCAEAATHLSERRSREAFAAIKKLISKPGMQNGSMLRVGDEVVHDQQVVAQQWRAKWQEHFQAREERSMGFDSWEVPGDRQLNGDVHQDEHYFSEKEIAQAFKGMNKHRASPDSLHFSYW